MSTRKGRPEESPLPEPATSRVATKLSDLLSVPEERHEGNHAATSAALAVHSGDWRTDVVA